MTKVKAILRIESFSIKDGTLLLSVSDYGVRSAIKSLEELSVQKYGGYIKCEITPPYKSRTTGKGSQNSKIWAMIPESMTKINTVDASLLIDELYKLAAELGITLEE